jgi:Flp pilus assembly protein TadG
MSARRGRVPGRGQALVEFALIFPIAIVLLLAVFDVGRAVFMSTGLTNAAREGARLAIVNQSVVLVEQRVQDMAAMAEVSNIGDASDPVVTFRRQTPNADPLSNAACSPVATGCVAVVIARAEWSAITPIIGALLGPISLSARSELPVEFVCPNPNIAAYANAASCPKQP